MAYASQSGRARTSLRSPQAHAICDRCNFRFNHVDLQWQYDFAGSGLINKQILVCRRCLDTPQEQLRAIILSADPVPILNPRTQNFEEAETNYQTISLPPVTDAKTGIPIPSTTNLITEDGKNMTMQITGTPTGMDSNAVMPLYGENNFRVPLNPLSIVSNGATIVNVTCSSPHNLSNDSQIAVEGLSNPFADGIWSINVTTAVAFNYELNQKINAGSLLTSTTTLFTAKVGLPRGYNQIPETGL